MTQYLHPGAFIAERKKQQQQNLCSYTKVCMQLLEADSCVKVKKESVQISSASESLTKLRCTLPLNTVQQCDTQTT